MLQQAFKYLNILSAIILTAILLIYFYFQWAFQYWKRKNLPQLEASIPFGTTQNPIKRQVAEGVEMKQLYDRIKEKNLKHCGIYSFSIPLYFVRDLDYIKNVMTKDFGYFSDRGFYVNEKDDPISAHLFAIGGNKWRSLRTKVTPTFTSGKMKAMFQTLVDCGIILEQYMQKIEYENKPVDIKDVLAKFTTDIIGSCAFGIDCNTFKEPDSPFRKYGKKVFEMNTSRIIQLTIAFTFQNLGRALRIRQMPKDVSEFFFSVVKNTVDFRKSNNYVRKDFIQLLIDMKDKENSLTMSELTAQCFVFFFAGFETSSTTMTFALYELSINQEIQEKLRFEILTVLEKHNGKITYESISEMHYMDQVIDETLRKYPPVPFVTRECVKDYHIKEDNATIEKGVVTVIPILGIHYDEDLYPNPTEFDPERFSKENKNNRHPYAHIPFGEGPRICIGMRFGLMQTKVGLASLLRNFKFTLSDKTKLPLKMKSESLVLTTEGDMWLNFKKI